MNVTFLLITLLVTIATAGSIAWLTFTASELSFATAAVGMIATIIMLAVSFGATNGAPIVQETTAFKLERTPYRIVVTALGREATFTDARTVAQANDIVKARLIIQRNAWGITHENSPSIGPKIELVFSDGTSVSASPTRRL